MLTIDHLSCKSLAFSSSVHWLYSRWLYCQLSMMSDKHSDELVLYTDVLYHGLCRTWTKILALI